MENYPPPPPNVSKIHREKSQPSTSVPPVGWTIVDSQDDFVWPCQRSLHAGAMWRDCFIVFGGYDGRHRVNDMYSFNFKTSNWELLQYPNVPSPRDRHVAVVFEDCLYVFGGFDGAARINDLHEFNLELREWRQVPIRSGLPPSARHSHAAVVYHTSMFIFGGYDGAYRNDFHEFNFVTRTWGLVHSTGEIPRARYRGTCVVSNDNMILHGGHDGSQHLQDTYIFDFNTSTWSTLICDGPVPSARDSHIAVMHKKSMFLYGGSTGLAMDDFYELKLEFRSCWRTVDYHADHQGAGRDSGCGSYSGGGGGGGGGSLRSPGRPGSSNSGGNTEAYRSPPRPTGNSSSNNQTPNGVSLIGGGGGGGGGHGHGQSSSSHHHNASHDEGDLITPGPRFCHVGVVYDNALYIFGGYDGVQRLNDFLKYPFERNDTNIVAPPSSLISDLKKYVDNDLLSDVKFVVEDRPIHAHKILCLRSPYFHSLLTGEYMESRASEIVIPEVKHSIFLLLLEYIYTDDVEFSLDEAMDLFQAADRFGVERLKSICEQKMLDAIDIESVARTLTMADERNADNLRERCILFILRHFDQVSKTQEFELMGHSNIALVFEILKRR